MSESSILPSDLAARLRELKQDRLLAYLKNATPTQQAALIAQLKTLDWPAVADLMRDRAVPPAAHEEFSPISVYAYSADGKREKELGEEWIRAGKLALFTVAGGQGSRLGFEGPKGAIGVTPVTKTSLFAVFAQKLLAAQKRYGTIIPWILMTSPLNDGETKAFFAQNQNFGLRTDQLFFFTQGVMPAIDAKTGDLLQESAESLALSPDGHGGSLKGLYHSGALSWLAGKGVATLSYFQVDNPLIRLVDPLFVGAGEDLVVCVEALQVLRAGRQDNLQKFFLGNLIFGHNDLPAAREIESHGPGTRHVAPVLGKCRAHFSS